MPRKLISTFVAISFIFSNIAFADSLHKDQSVLNPKNIIIEKDHGLIKSRFSGNSNKFIINIQDAHCNYEAQTNIVNILETLIRSHSLSLISVEGADGLIDTTWFKAFPDEEVRKEVATYFMKKGEITGPEFLSITKNYPVKLFGAEDRDAYIQNLNAFTSSYPLKADTEKYYNSIKSALNRLKGYIYSNDLKAMDIKSQDYESKKIQFNDYVRFLQGEAEKTKINIRSYENFFRLVSVLIYEKKIDFNVTDKERSSLIDELSKVLAKDALTELVSQSISFKSGKISSVEFYNFLKKCAFDSNIDLSKKYPNLYNYIIYNSVYSKIDNEKLFNDIKTVENDIKEKLFTSDDQRALDKLSRHIDILLGMVNIKLLNGDFNYYQTHKDEFAHEVFADFIKKQGVKYGLAYDVEPPSEAVAKSMPKLEDFYAIATKRDNALVENTLKEMDRENQQIAVLVTGGFHSEGMAKLLEKQGISYIVVCPSITKDVPTPYIQILTNQRTPIEDILTTPDTSKKGMLAAMSMVQLAPHDEKHIRALFAAAVKSNPEIQKIIDGVVTRAEGVHTGWLTMDVSRWLVGRLNAARNNPYARSEEFMKEVYAKDAVAGLRKIKIAEKGGAELTRSENKAASEAVDSIVGSREFGRYFHSIYERFAPKVENIGAIRGKGEQGAITIDGVELTPAQKIEVNGKIRDDFNAGTARLVTKEGNIEIYEIPSLADCSYLVAHPGRGGEACDHSKRRIYMSPSRVQSYMWLKITSQAKWNEFVAHETAHIDNPRLSEDVIEVLAPSHNVRLALLTRDMENGKAAAVESAYKRLYNEIVENGREYTSEEAAKEFKVSRDIANVLLDKVNFESGYNRLKKEMYESVIANTPQVIKDNQLVDLSEKGEIKITLTKENLEDFDAIKNPKGMNLRSWLARYRKEASVSTAGIRGVQNILFPNEPRELIGQKAIILATLAKALVAKELYKGSGLHKLASSEVRYNSKEYVEFIARIQAALGIKTHLPLNKESIPIWMASFLIFRYDMLGGEYVTSSHAISKKIATKDLNDQGSQYISEESELFVDKIAEIIKTIEDEGSFTITLAPRADASIDEDFMKKVNNGINDYVEYLRKGIATKDNLDLINQSKKKIFVDVVGGCMYRTMSKIFEKLGILDRFNWLHIKEDPYFHGIGKSCYRLNLQTGKLTLEDLSCDTSIVAINSRYYMQGPRSILPLFTNDILTKIAEKDIGTQILVPVPDLNSKIFCQIRSTDDIPQITRFTGGSVEYLQLGAGKVLVIEIEKKILPVIRTMGYKTSLKEAPIGTVILLTDPDGDRLITAEVTSSADTSLLENLGVAYEALDDNKVLAVFQPNQSFLMTVDFRRKMLVKDKQWDNHNWFIIKTTASAASWDDWAAMQIDKSYRIKRVGSDIWEEAKGVPVINTPVGFKDIASVMKKAEKQMREAPDKPVTIEDIYGNEIELGVQPRLLFAGEESGGEIFGPTAVIKSVNGRVAIAMREKSAGEAMVITSAMAAYLEGNSMSLVGYLSEICTPAKQMITHQTIRSRYDYREDVIYFNESEPNPEARKLAEREGLRKKEENDFFYLAIAMAVREGKVAFEHAKEFLQATFPEVKFSNLMTIHFVGDGVYFKFTDRMVEIRPSGTEAKTKAYALGTNPEALIHDAKILGSYYSEDARESLKQLLGESVYAEYFTTVTYKGAEMPTVKARSLEIYNTYLRKGAETKPFVPPADYSYLSISASSKQESKNAEILGKKLHTPLVAANPETAKLFRKGGYKQPGYGVSEGAAIDGSFAIGNEGNQGYYVNGGREVFSKTVADMKEFFQKRYERLGNRPIRYVIKPGIGGQHTPFQGIADVFQLIDVTTGRVVGEYELGKNYEEALSAALKEVNADWDQIAVIPSSKSGSTDETMMIFTEIFYVLLKNVATGKGVDGEFFAQTVLNTMHDVNFENGKEVPAKGLFEGFSINGVVNRFGGRLGYGGVKKILGIVLGNMFFETTDNPEESRLSAFIRNSGLDKELDKEDIPGFGAMFENVGGRWTADLHMMTFLAYHGLDAGSYWNTRYKGIVEVREGKHPGYQLGNKILDEGITDIALVVPDEFFWFGKAMEQNFNESIWQKGFANLVAIKESAWEAQKGNYAGKPERLVINLAGLNAAALPPNLFKNVVNLKAPDMNNKDKQVLANALGDLFTTFYGMTNTVGNRLIVRALAEKGYTLADVDLNDLDNHATKIVQQNLYVRQPYVELGKGLLETKLTELQAQGQQAVDAELDRIKVAARSQRIESNIPELNLPANIAGMEQLANAINAAVKFAEKSNRKFVPFIYVEGAKFQELREHLTRLGIEWVLQGTGDQHISYQQVLAQPQKYLPFIVSFIPENTLPGRPAVGFAKSYLNNVSPNMVRDLFAEASYKALTEPRKNEAGEEVKGAAGIFMRITDSEDNRAMLAASFTKGMVTAREETTYEEVKALIETEKAELDRTLTMSMMTANPSDGIVIIGVDDSLYAGYANKIVTGLPELIKEKTRPGTVMMVRGKGQELVDNIRNAVEAAKDGGVKVRAVINQVNAATPDNVKNELSGFGKVLSVDLGGKNLNEYYPQALRLFNLMFQVAYDFKPEDISATLSRITGKTVSVEDVIELLAKKILEILPRLTPIDMSDAPEIYRAARRAMEAL